jgi:tRNA(Ile)-lysidine synthetase-like protein
MRAGYLKNWKVRARRPGDRFEPFGMDGHTMKLSDFFINEKLPQRAREAWPLLCSGRYGHLGTRVSSGAPLPADRQNAAGDIFHADAKINETAKTAPVPGAVFLLDDFLSFAVFGQLS